ncbi:MAG: hypothetical protein ACKV0T_10290 [Planctomycetales bacterium]
MRNWETPQSAFLGKLHVFQVAQPADWQVLVHSSALSGLIASRMPSHCIVVRESDLPRFKRLLKGLGFDLSGNFIPHEPWAGTTLELKSVD